MGHCMGLLFPLTTHRSITLCSFVPFTFATSTCGSAKVCTACASRQQQLAPAQWLGETCYLRNFQKKRGENPAEIFSYCGKISSKGSVIWTNLRCHKQMQGIVVSGMSIGLDPIRTICMPENIAICSLLTFMSYSQIRLLESNRSLGTCYQATVHFAIHIYRFSVLRCYGRIRRLHYHPHKKMYF